MKIIEPTLWSNSKNEIREGKYRAYKSPWLIVGTQCILDVMFLRPEGIGEQQDQGPSQGLGFSASH